MDPIIVITPTHAFLCYATQPDDDSDCNCLETTMTGSASFEEAAYEGDQEYLEELKSGNFDSGESHIWSIRALREGGVSPMQ
jgi:hypothetical protein